jgi:hypothetical protein
MIEFAGQPGPAAGNLPALPEVKANEFKISSAFKGSKRETAANRVKLKVEACQARGRCLISERKEPPKIIR